MAQQKEKDKESGGFFELLESVKKSPALEGVIKTGLLGLLGGILYGSATSCVEKKGVTVQFEIQTYALDMCPTTTRSMKQLHYWRPCNPQLFDVMLSRIDYVLQCCRDISRYAGRLYDMEYISTQCVQEATYFLLDLEQFCDYLRKENPNLDSTILPIQKMLRFKAHDWTRSTLLSYRKHKQLILGEL